jgi:anti-sigma factor RsiW
MDCSTIRGDLGAWRDGELDPDRAAAIAGHVSVCPDCAVRARAHAALAAALGDRSLAFPPPPALAKKIARGGRTRRTAVPWLAAAAGLLLGLGIMARRERAVRGEDLAAELAGNQVRALQPGKLADVLSSDRHTVKPWFAGKLDFAPVVEDLAAEGFPLVGGRVDALAGRPAAALVYARRRHVISVYVCPAAGMPGAVSPEYNGFHVRHWRRGDMAFWAVSDLDPAELDRFVALLRARPA